MQILLYDALNFISETVEEKCLKFPAQPDKTFLGPWSTKLSGYASKDACVEILWRIPRDFIPIQINAIPIFLMLLM